MHYNFVIDAKLLFIYFIKRYKNDNWAQYFWHKYNTVYTVHLYSILFSFFYSFPAAQTLSLSYVCATIPPLQATVLLPVFATLTHPFRPPSSTPSISANPSIVHVLFYRIILLLDTSFFSFLFFSLSMAVTTIFCIEGRHRRGGGGLVRFFGNVRENMIFSAVAWGIADPNRLIVVRTMVVEDEECCDEINGRGGWWWRRWQEWWCK